MININSILITASIALVLGVGSSLVAYKEGYKKAHNEVSLVFQEYKLAAEKEYNNALEDNIRLKGLIEHNQMVARLDKEKELERTRSYYRNLLSSLQQRAERPPAPSSSTDSNTDAATSDAGGKGSTGKELYREDGEFLAGEAASADILKQGLIECRRRYDDLYNELQSVPNRNNPNQ